MFKIGHSYDIHQLQEGEELILGSIKIEHYKGTVGHSDADCLLHAITESIIGALAMGDIGTFFPDTDEKYKGMKSSFFLEEINKVMIEKGYKINNIDSTIYIERPKMRPYIDLMRKEISNILNIDIDCINIKATRGEKLGFIGREEGVAAEAVVLISNG